MTVRAALAGAIDALRAASASPRLDAEVLLAGVRGCARAALHAHADDSLAAAERKRFDALVARRAAGEPVAHLLGEREFWSLPLAVSPAVLIPRPDTETLVLAALEVGGAGARTVADLGTGSGAVAIALAGERRGWHVVATDVDHEALAVAQRNVVRHQPYAVELRHGDWYEALAGERFDLIVSNPPYIRDTDPHLEQGDVRFEPRAALVAGVDGLDAIRAIVAGAPAHLTPGGWLLLEHGYDQAEAVARLLGDAGFTDVRAWKDLGGHLRVTGANFGVRPHSQTTSNAAGVTVLS